MHDFSNISRRGFIASMTGFAFPAMLGLAGCKSDDGSESTPTGDGNTDATDSDEKALNDGTDNSTETAPASSDADSPVNGITVVFSWSGNTASVADAIADCMRFAPVWHLVPEEPYPKNYDECTDVALQEQRDGTLPPYLNDIPGWDGYEVVFLGYPIWWGDLPQVVKSFVRDRSWEGKKVIPFITSQSSGWSGTPDAIREMCHGATVLDGISILQSELPGRLSDVPSWLAGLGLPTSGENA